MFDNHIHTNFSDDSTMESETAIKTALSLGLKGLAFTDHLDIDYPGFNSWFMIDFSKYSNHMNALKDKYSDTIKILKGIEIGIQPHVLEKTNSILEKYDFDFVIGSVHVVDKTDLHNNDFCKFKTRIQSYTRYLEEVINMLNSFENFDILGHLDLIRRYGDYDDKTLSYDDFPNLIDEILSLVIKKDKGIEVNSSGFRYKLNSTMPDYSIIKRYYQLGGKKICIGSDAHSPEFIAYKFDEIRKDLYSLGFRYLVHFERRKEFFTPLTS